MANPFDDPLFQQNGMPVILAMDMTALNSALNRQGLLLDTELQARLMAFRNAGQQDPHNRLIITSLRNGGLKNFRLLQAAVRSMDASELADSWNVYCPPIFPPLIPAPEQVDLITDSDRLDCDTAPYPMKRRGRALIINQKTFGGGDVRHGTDKDANDLEAVYKQLGFDTHVVHDLDGQQIRDHAYTLAKHDHSNYDAVIVTILSHGTRGMVSGTDWADVRISKITSYFKGDVAKSLVGKPKIFIVQACRGEKSDHGTVSDTAKDADKPTASGMDVVPDTRLSKLPLEADMIIAHSSVSGYGSYRHEVEGSWFIQSLVKVLKANHQKEHFLDMLTMVNDLVATEFECKDGMQMPECKTRLRKKLYLR